MPFGSPACDYIESNLDLNHFLVPHPIATYFMRMSGDSLKSEGIFEGDILVVDRSLPTQDNKLIIAELNGELTARRLRLKNGQNWLLNSNTPPHRVKDNDMFSIWGLVTAVIRKI